ncbi:unnamed protein product [Closterium sp. NIES-65]|nr:unnamed protein product [Closterium sp. NIES-65]
MALPCRQLLAAVCPTSVFHVIDTWVTAPDAATSGTSVNAVNGPRQDPSAGPWSLALTKGGGFAPATGGSGGREEVLRRLGGALGGSGVGQVGEGNARGRGISGTAAPAGVPQPVSEVSGAEAEVGAAGGADAGAAEGSVAWGAEAEVEVKAKVGGQAIAEDTEPMWTLDLDPIRRGSFRLGQLQRAQGQSSSNLKEGLSESIRVSGGDFSSTNWEKLVAERFSDPQRAEPSSSGRVSGSGVRGRGGEGGGECGDGARQQCLVGGKEQRRQQQRQRQQQVQLAQQRHYTDSALGGIFSAAPSSSSAAAVSSAAGGAAAASAHEALERGDGRGGMPVAEEALWRARVAELMRVALEEVEERRSKLKVRAEDEERQRQREVEAFKKAAEEYRREQQEMMKKRMGPRTGMGKQLMSQWFARLKSAVLEERARYETGGERAPSSSAASGGSSSSGKSRGGGTGVGQLTSADRALQVFGDFLVKVDAEKLAAITLNRTVDLLLSEQVRMARGRDGAQGQRQGGFGGGAGGAGGGGGGGGVRGETEKGHKSFAKAVSLATQIGKAVEVEMNLARVQEEVRRSMRVLKKKQRQQAARDAEQAEAGAEAADGGGAAGGGAVEGAVGGAGAEGAGVKGKGKGKAGKGGGGAGEAGAGALAGAGEAEVDMERMAQQRDVLRKLRKESQLSEWQKKRLVAAAVAQAQEPWSTEHYVQVGSCLIQLLLQSAHVPKSLLTGKKKGDGEGDSGPDGGAAKGKKEGEGVSEGKNGAAEGGAAEEEFVPAFVMDRVKLGTGGAHQRYGVVACATELSDILDNFVRRHALEQHNDKMGRVPLLQMCAAVTRWVVRI